MRSVTSSETSNNQLNTRPFKPIVFKIPPPSNSKSECEVSPFSMAAYNVDNANQLRSIVVENGKPKVHTHFRRSDLGNAVPIVFNGLLGLKQFIESKSSSYVLSTNQSHSASRYYLSASSGNIEFPTYGPQVVVFEVYGVEGSREAVWANLCKIDPRLDWVGYIAVPAPASNLIGPHGELVSSGEGWRFYCLTYNDSCLSRYCPLFSMRSWIQGLSGVSQIESGKYAIKEYVNAEAFNPDHLLIEAPATLGEGFIRSQARIEFSPGGLLYTQPFPYLNEVEKSILVNNCAQAIARCPLSTDAANVEKLAIALWHGVLHDELIPASNSREYPSTNPEVRRNFVNRCVQLIAKYPLSFEAANVDRLARAMWSGASFDAQKGGDQHE